ncbi:hypothetical protein [Sphingobium sp.]|uniref:hypothetical protein n=1 Tax=Sphingobium sp. TaxID=1912891 RepID=UPI0028BF0684|nr:hypothetical protein [Sphingobium sp.]
MDRPILIGHAEKAAEHAGRELRGEVHVEFDVATRDHLTDHFLGEYRDIAFDPANDIGRKIRIEQLAKTGVQRWIGEQRNDVRMAIFVMRDIAAEGAEIFEHAHQLVISPSAPPFDLAAVDMHPADRASREKVRIDFSRLGARVVLKNFRFLLYVPVRSHLYLQLYCHQ